MKHIILIVGGGSIGERHVRCFSRTERADITLCEPNEARGREVAERYGIRHVTDYATALEARPECVVICTPAPLHVGMAMDALSAGAHVLIEKPLSVSLDGIADLERAAETAGKSIGVAYIWHWHPALRKARALLNAGEIGEPLHGLAASGQDFATLRPGYEKTYYANRENGGGGIQDGLTHAANAVEFLLGPATSVVCEADHLAIAAVEVEDTVGVVARHGKALVVHSFSQVQKPNEMVIDLHGTRGSLRIDMAGKRLGHFHDGAWHWENTPYKDHDELFTAQAASLLDTAEGTGSMACSLRAGLATLKFNLACLESASTGRRVSL